MIENEELGLKVAEDKEEAYWKKLEEESDLMIERLKREIIIHEEIVKLAKKKQSTHLNTK